MTAAKPVPSYLAKYLAPVQTKTNVDYEEPKKRKKKSKVRTKASSMKIVDEDAGVSVENLKKKKKTRRDDEAFRRMALSEEYEEDDEDEEVGELAPVIVNSEDLETEEEKKKKRNEAERKVEGTWVTISEGPSTQKRDQDSSPPRRRRRHDSEEEDNGGSNSRQSKNVTTNSEDFSPPRRRRRDDDGDISPPRRRPAETSRDISPPRRRKDTDRDISPPRRRDTDRDISPPRRRSSGGTDKDNGDISPPRKQKPEKMLDGTRAGLVTGADVQRELEVKKQEEQRRLAKMDPKDLGRDAATVFRDKRGRKLEMLNELVRQQEGRFKEDEETKMEWGVGLVQKGQREEKKKMEERERMKPFARTKDDEDMNSMLSSISRWGDPMASLVKTDTTQDLNRPIYRGPPAPPNRFGIQPGHRWDGVDRSNGFEKKLFELESKKVAMKEVSYKWSVEDM